MTRYNRGICALEDADYVYIHDGARPFIDNALLCRARDTANNIMPVQQE